MSTIRFECPFVGCGEHFGTTGGVRHHWLSRSGHPTHTLPALVASDLIVKYEFKDGQYIRSTLYPVVPDSQRVSDAELIEMMGLDDSAPPTLDIKSAGRFGRASRFGTLPCVSVEVPETNNWTAACSAYFSHMFTKINDASVHEQQVLADKKAFIPVRAAPDNYRCSLLVARCLHFKLTLGQCKRCVACPVFRLRF